MGTVGAQSFLLLVSYRDGEWIEGVGVRPGQSASRIEGTVVQPPPHPHSATQALQATLTEVETLIGTCSCVPGRLVVELVDNCLKGRREGEAVSVIPPSVLARLRASAAPEFTPLIVAHSLRMAG